MLAQKLIKEQSQLKTLFIDFKRRRLVSEANFIAWAEHEARTDANISPETKLKIKHKKLNASTLGLFFGHNRMAIHKLILEHKDHFNYIETLRHELEHYRFEKLKSDEMLYKKLKTLSKTQINILYHVLDHNFLKRELGLLLEKEFSDSRKKRASIKIKMIVRLTNESLAYWHEIRFINKIIDLFLTQNKIPHFFQIRPSMEENKFNIALPDQKTKLKMAKNKKNGIQEILKRRFKNIDTILKLFRYHSSQEIYELLIQIYKRHGFPVDSVL